jgi:hypothetical protein
MWNILTPWIETETVKHHEPIKGVKNQTIPNTETVTHTHHLRVQYISRVISLLEKKKQKQLKPMAKLCQFGSQTMLISSRNDPSTK